MLYIFDVGYDKIKVGSYCNIDIVRSCKKDIFNSIRECLIYV